MHSNRRNRWQQPFISKAKIDPAQPEPLTCGWDGCASEACYPAPAGNGGGDTKYNFCLYHVRLYNKAWDYWQNMTPEEIETYMEHAKVGHRPTWTFGQRPSSGRKARLDKAWHAWFGPGENNFSFNNSPATSRLSSPVKEALNLFGLQPPVSADILKQRYKTLAKQHHPDLHGQDKTDKLKAINQAYEVLKTHLAELGGPAF